MRKPLFIAYILWANFVSGTLMAAEGGYSNYIPGTYGDFAMSLAPAETWTLRNDVYYYGADLDKSVRGGLLEAEADLDFLINFTTLLYKPDLEFFGAQYATGFLVPVVHAEIDTSISLGPFLRELDDSDSGLGDVALIPFMFYWQADNFYWSFSHFIVTPVGNYDMDNAINTGLNYWSFDTNFALTYLNPETGRDLSFNLGHIYNTENNDTDYQTGQELHLDYALNQWLSENLAVGVHGFYLEQVSGDSGDGAILGDFKGEAAGVGPALLWSHTIGKQNVTFIAKWLHEIHAERRLKGDHVFISFVLDW